MGGQAQGGSTYDNELAPLMPGQLGRYITVGGGVLDIDADSLEIDGTLDASALIRTMTYEYGGSAGGSIWLNCRDWAFGKSACFKADGMISEKHDSHRSGAGGGGRIALARGLTAETKAELRANGTSEGVSLVAPLAAVVNAAAKGGAIVSAEKCGGAGEDGSAVLYFGQDPGKANIVQTAEPAAIARSLPSAFFGVKPFEKGGPASVTVDRYWYLNDEETVRLEVVGWTLTDADGEILASDEGTTCSVDALDGNAVLTWHLSDEQYRISYAGLGTGEVTGPEWGERGKLVTPTATGEQAVMQWLVPGILDLSRTGSSSFTFSPIGPCTVTAVFADRPSSPKAYAGVSGGDWDEPGNWSPAGVPGPGDAVSIPAGTVVGAKGGISAASIQLGEGATLSVFGAVNDYAVNKVDIGTLTVDAGTHCNIVNLGRAAFDMTSTELVSVQVSGAIEVGANARLAVGGFMQTAPVIVSAQSLTLAGGAKAAFYPGALDGSFATFRTGGGRLVVADTLEVQDGAELVLHGHIMNQNFVSTAAAFAVDAGTFRVAEGGLVTSATGGNRSSDLPGGATDGNWSGAGHGGVGGYGTSASTPGGTAYDYAYAPRYPGAPGRFNCNFGGGQIRVRTDLLALAGTLDASSTVINQSWEQGGGAGGSVFVDAKETDIAATAVILAKGMDGVANNASQHNGGGAGGRISVLVKATDECREALWATGDWLDSGFSKKDLLENAEEFPGAVSVAGGVGKNGAGNGGVGTAYLCECLDASTVLVTIEADVVCDGAVFEPALGTVKATIGDELTLTAPSVQYPVADGTVRHRFASYTLYDADGGEIETKAGVPSLTLTLEGPVRVVWHYGAEEYRLVTDAGTSWKNVGESVTLESADAGFTGWLYSGSASEAMLRNRRLTFTMNAPVVAHALTSAASSLAEKTFAGEDGGAWHEPSNWSPAGVPGWNDAVVIPAGRTVAAVSTVCAGSLTVSSGAALSVFGSTTSVCDVVEIPHLGGLAYLSKLGTLFGRPAADETRRLHPAVLVAGDCTVAGRISLGGQFALEGSVLQTGGDLTVAGAGSLLNVYAAPTNGVERTDATAGGRVTAGGTFTVGAGALVESFDAQGRTVDSVRLGWVRFAADSIVVEEGGVLKAACGGGSSVIDTYELSRKDSQVAGAGHGGAGGDGYQSGCATGGVAYALAYWPSLPGKSSRYGDTFGGGLLVLEASSVKVNGRISADAEKIISTYEHGGASGGTVRIRTERISFGDAGLVSANGNFGENPNASMYGAGGGGGGRIAVLLRVSDKRVDWLRREQTSRYDKFDIQDQTAPGAQFAGHFSVSGGAKGESPHEEAKDGEDGTAYVVKSLEGGFVVTVR